MTLPLLSKGISFGLITAHADGTLDTSDVEGVDDDLRVKPFFARGLHFSMRQFDVGAFQAELGLQSHDPDLHAACSGAGVVTPAGMEFLPEDAASVTCPPVSSPIEDADGDDVVNEVHPAIEDHLEFYLLNYFKPALGQQTNRTKQGFKLMAQIECTSCHIRDLLIKHDRRVADVETVFDPAKAQGSFNRLFATAITRFVEIDDDSGHPTLKSPKGDPFEVRNIFTDSSATIWVRLSMRSTSTVPCTKCS